MVKRNPNTLCIVCGEPIYRKPKDINKSKTGCYCKKCWGSWRKNKGSWNKGNSKKVTVMCEGCNNQFLTISSRLGKVKYCSNKCYTKYGGRGGCRNKGKHWNLKEETKKKISESQKGNKNHNWLGGITNPRKNSESVMWSRRIKKRDKHCLICGSNKNLNSHHIESFNSNKELRYNDSNGIALCKPHHDAFHKIYKNGNNTRKQFNEFVCSFFKKIDKIEKSKIIKPVYNICLEDNSAFFANGILTHNTPNPTTPEEILSWVEAKIMPKVKVKGKNKKKTAKRIAENLAKHITKYGPRPLPFIRQTIAEDLPGILKNN